MNFPISNQHLFRAALLVLVLLLAQFALILHKAELANHSSAAVCEYCLTHADLTDGSTFVSHPPAVVPAASDAPAFFPAAFAAPRHLSYSARAPPLS